MRATKYLGRLKSLTFISVGLGLAFAPLLSILLSETVHALTAPVFTEYATASNTANPAHLANGPDGAIWFTSPGSNTISRISTGGVVTTYQVNTQQRVNAIVAGPDGAFWFTLVAPNSSLAGGIGRISLQGAITTFMLPAGHSPVGGSGQSITVGGDDKIWFVESTDAGEHGAIGRMTTSGVLTEYSYPSQFPNLTAIAGGTDGQSLWVSETAANINSTGGAVGRISMSTGAVTRFPYPTNPGSNDGPTVIVNGPDEKLWTMDNSGAIRSISASGTYGDFTQTTGRGSLVHSYDNSFYYAIASTGKIGRLSPAGSITQYSVPSSNVYTLTIGPDGQIWFTENVQRKIGKFTLPRPDAPTNLSVTKNPTNQAVALSWGASPEATRYSIYRNGALYANVNSPTTTFSDNNVNSGTYTYSVAASIVNGQESASSNTVTVVVDKGLPVVTGTPDRAPNASGWYTSNVTINWSVTDPAPSSGIVSQPAPTVASGTGQANYTSTPACDLAGNCTTGILNLKIDKVVPLISFSLSRPTPPGIYYNNDVVVSFSCSDIGSGVAFCPPPVTVGEGTEQAITGIVRDVAGNTDSVTAYISVDKTKPTIAYSIDPIPNAAGWNNNDVSVSYACADTLSGLDSCTNTQTVTAETNGQLLSGTAVDKAGNNESINTTIKLDKTDPTINYTLSQAPNGAGWNDGDVTINFTCDDNLSGVASCSAPVTLSEGSDQTVTGTATDVAGNTKTVAVTLNVDKTAPVVTSVVSPAPNAAGWHNADVSVGFNCSDLLSGVATCTDPQTVDTETAGQVVTGSATDVAGNTASASETIKLDKTKPTIAYSLSETPNANGWNKHDVTVSFACDDNLSGVAECSAPVTLGEGANQTVTGSVTDVAGNVNSVSLTLSIDKGLPTIISSISPAPNVLGWHNSDVTVSYTCDDNLSTIDICSSPQTITGDTDGLLVTGTAVDKADNAQTVSNTVKLDKTDPTINYSLSATPNLNNWLKQGVTVTFACADNLSGIATCSAPVTLTEGEAQTVTGTATDVAGNSKTASVTVNVDKTLPTISAVPLSSPNTAGWYKDDVIVGFNCADLLSGVDSCTDNQTVATEGTNNQVSGTVVDKAGNTASVSTTIKLDKTKPTINYSLSTPPNANGWNNSSVTVNFSCADSLSQVAACSAPVTVGEGANQVVTGTATDNAGNVQTVSVVVSVDSGKPTISYTINPTPNAAGWNKSNATVHFVCNDGLSQIDTCTSDQVVSNNTAGQNVTGTAVDRAGNSQSVTATVKLDKTAPTATNPGVSGGFLGIGGTRTFTATVTDNLSGIVRAEYYIDNVADPGLGNGTAMTISGNSASATNTNVPTGTHNAVIRTLDTAGNWSTNVTVQYSRIL